MQQYTSSMDPVDTERRQVNYFLQDTYYAYMDSLWSPDGMAAFLDPASKWSDTSLPTLTDGRGPLDFASTTEYQRALDFEFYSDFRKSGIPADLAGFPSGGKGSPSLGDLYGTGKPLPEAQAQQATVTVRSVLMKDWWAYNDAISIDYLSQPQNAEVLKDMRVWKKTDLPAALEQALTGYTPAAKAPSSSSSSSKGPSFLP